MSSCTLIYGRNNQKIINKEEFTIFDNQEEKKMNIENYYLSITGSFYNEKNALSEVYAVFDFDNNLTTKLLSIEATSSYPCAVCDLKNNMVYYAGAKETQCEGRIIMLDNVYAYDINTEETTQLTYYGYYMNRMIPVDDKLYFSGGKRSNTSVEFGYIDLTDNQVFYPDCYGEIGSINVRDIEYSYGEKAFYISWYSLVEQSRNNMEYSQHHEAERKIAERHLDKYDILSCSICPVESFCDFELESFSVSQNGCKILMYDPSNNSFRIHENNNTYSTDFLGSALNALSPDGESLYYITISTEQSNGAPMTDLKKYDFSSKTIEVIAHFDFYVNNMVLLQK